MQQNMNTCMRNIHTAFLPWALDVFAIFNFVKTSKSL